MKTPTATLLAFDPSNRRPPVTDKKELRTNPEVTQNSQQHELVSTETGKEGHR